MYRPDDRLFVFRVRREAGRLVPEGLSPRYTAIVVIGLARESETNVRAVLSGHSLGDLCRRLVETASSSSNIGDVALALWATRAAGFAESRRILSRLLELRPEGVEVPAVELSWAIVALAHDPGQPGADLGERLAARLLGAYSHPAGVFRHVVGQAGSGLRSHVSCFADMVYPIHALSRAFAAYGQAAALDAAQTAARRICDAQGEAGQWWWHYDNRTGAVIEGYPVYAVHQDSMAPMALFAIQEASGVDFSKWINRGLRWLASSPELDGGSLVDPSSDLIWRKVARSEPGKLSRFAQAAASRIHPSLRIPELGVICQPNAIDFEDRPYHLGWVLYAWPPDRAQQWR